MTENRTLQVDYLVNDTTYPGPEGSVVLRYNITILPVPISFNNTTYLFTVNRRASAYALVATLLSIHPQGPSTCFHLFKTTHKFRLTLTHRHTHTHMRHSLSGYLSI